MVVYAESAKKHMEKILSTNQTPTWCPGCGAYAVSAALKKAIRELKIKRRNVVICYDIGCSGNMINLINVCGFETLHGRSIPVASGIKAARPELTVIAQAGDGGLLNEGSNHFIHAAQRNDPIVLIVNNNLVFGLTAGQRSSATPQGARTRGAGEDSKMLPLSVVELAGASGAKFIARVPEGDIELAGKIIEKAIRFKGFAVVEVIQPCKIWAKDFRRINYKKITKPLKNRAKLIGRDNLVGLLYLEQ